VNMSGERTGADTTIEQCSGGSQQSVNSPRGKSCRMFGCKRSRIGHLSSQSNPTHLKKGGSNQIRSDDLKGGRVWGIETHILSSTSHRGTNSKSRIRTGSSSPKGTGSMKTRRMGSSSPGIMQQTRGEQTASTTRGSCQMVKIRCQFS